MTRISSLGTTSRMVRPFSNAGQTMARSRMLLQAIVASTEKTRIPQRTINVMTYNILAQKYAQNGWHNYCPAHHLRWEYRKALLLEELEAYGSDIICLQEVEANVFSRELQPWLAERGYQGHYLARQYGENVQGAPEGVALFYRTDVFELLQHRSITFSSMPTNPPAPLSPWLSSSDAEDSETTAAPEALDTAPATAAAPSAAAGAAPEPEAPLRQRAHQQDLQSLFTASDSDAQATDDEDAVTRESEVLRAPGTASTAAMAMASAGSQSSSYLSSVSIGEAGLTGNPASLPTGAFVASYGGSSSGGGGGGSTGRSLRGVRGVSNGSVGKKGHGRWATTVGAAVGATAAESRPSVSSDGLSSLDEELPAEPSSATPLLTATGDNQGRAASTSSRSSSSSNRCSKSSTMTGSSSSSSGTSGGKRATRGNNEFWSVFARRQEGAILALLRHRPTQRRLLAAVTHLFWNPAFPDVKAFQAAVLSQEMAAFVRYHCSDGGGSGPAPTQGSDLLEEVPVVLAGDFNSLSRKKMPDVFDPKIPRGSDGLVSGVYTLLTRGSLPPDHPDHPSSRRRPGETSNSDFRGRELNTSGIRLASAYRLANGRDPPLTTRTATFAGCLDYIFVSPQHFEVTSTLDLPYDLPFSSYDNVRDPLSDVEFPPIPNGAYPSDHLSLVAVLRFRG